MGSKPFTYELSLQADHDQAYIYDYPLENFGGNKLLTISANLILYLTPFATIQNQAGPAMRSGKI